MEWEARGGISVGVRGISEWKRQRQGKGDIVMIPSCADLTILACQNALTSAGYVPGQTIGIFSQDVVAGLVATTSPVGEAALGTVVNLYVSQGALGFTMFNQAFWGVLTAFSIGIFMGIFIKLTNKS